MNLAKIRHLASDVDLSKNTLRYLIDCRNECEHLDYKSIIELDTDHGCACLGRDALGMKNVGGGYIVIGVEDKTWKPIGISNNLPYDTKMIRDKIRKSTGLDLEVDIVHHKLNIDGEEKIFAMLLIRSTIKRSKLRLPSMCKMNFHAKENWGIRQGDIYIRVGDETKRLDNELDLQKILDDLEDRYQEDELESANSLPSPFAVESGYYRLLPREYEVFIGRQDLRDRLRSAIEEDPRLWIINLHGPGGVGKSALATWLAYDCYKDNKFEGILHLSAKDLELSTIDGMRHLTPTLVSLEDFLDRILHLFEHGEFCTADLDKRKEVVVDILSAFKTLLVLDNMETVGDGRIMEFIRDLPPRSLTKVLLTSRRRSSEWEYPIQVTEFNRQEIKDFLEIKSKEMRINFPYENSNVLDSIVLVTGGLPLAIQWTLGEFTRSRDLDLILNRAVDKDSPLLEFSFRNSWNALDNNAKLALAVLTIFDSPPTLQLWRTALDWPIEKTEKAINQLIEVTFVTERTESTTGNVTYQALPITLTFARNELAKLGDLERQARIRYQQYINRLELASVESHEYEHLFHRFDARTDKQKQAIILSRMAEGQAKSFGYDEAEQFYRQALDMDPTSVYALVSYAQFKLELHNDGEAIDLMERAAERATNKTGFFVFFNLAKAYDQVRDRYNRIKFLKEALKYEPKNVIARHSLGVALGQKGDHVEAILIFDEIIQEELSREGLPSDSLEVALRTKLISLSRMDRKSNIVDCVNDVITQLKSKGIPDYIIANIETMKDEEY